MAIIATSFLLFCLLGSALSGTEASCGGVLTNVSGVITSPNYPNNYPNNITCTWKISAEKTHLNLTIEDFMLEDSQTCEEADFVRIQPKVVSSWEYVSVCAAIASRQISLKVEGIATKITFKSDLSTNERGFKISYRAYDIDPCLDNNGSCSHFCNLVKGKRVCSCPSGYKLKWNSRTCADEKSCYFRGHQVCSYRLRPRTTCKDKPGGEITCECWTGYKEQNGICYDINECKEKPGRCGVGNCSNYHGWFSCRCPKGFASDGTTCKDIDECKYKRADCGDRQCVNTPGSYICQCAPGYQFNESLSTCQDINECDTSSHGCGHVCTNTNGSYTCSCRPGFFLDSDGKTCRAARIEGLGRVHNTMTCEGESLDINCEDNQQAIIIFMASYDRMQSLSSDLVHSVCPNKYKQGLPENDSTQCQKDVTDRIKELCGWRRRCDVTVNNETLGEVCPGVHKYLAVLHSCGKPLVCPTLLPKLSCPATGENECASDESCHSSQMCCFDGCKRVCAIPTLYSADT